MIEIVFTENKDFAFCACMSKVFEVKKNVLEQIEEQAKREYPSEMCGWIIQRANGTQEYYPSPNLQDKYHRIDPENYPRDSKTAFLLDVRKLQKVLDQLQEKDHLYSIVHSHIDCAAYFSEEDKRQMTDPFTHKPIYNATMYLVVEVRRGQVRDHKVFYFDEQQDAFLEGKLQVI